jgi:hypothetical protein
VEAAAAPATVFGPARSQPTAPGALAAQQETSTPQQVPIPSARDITAALSCSNSPPQSHNHLLNKALEAAIIGRDHRLIAGRSHRQLASLFV